MTALSASPNNLRKFLPVVFLLALSLLINYVDRGNLSLAAPTLKIELGLSPTQLGLLFSSFFWPYTIALLFMGWLVDRFDVNWVLLIGFSLWSVATAATGLAHTFTLLLIMRMFLGLGESVAFPSVSKILATHVSDNFRGLANGICIAGMKLGAAVGAFGAGFLIVTYGWRRIFLYIGCLSLIWVPLWLLYKPSREVQPVHVTASSLPLNWTRLFSIRSFWGTCLGHFSSNYILYFMVSWLPLYLIQDRHLSPHSMVIVAGVYYSADASIALFTGWLTDKLIRAGYTVTGVRKSVMLIGQTLCALGLLGCAIAGPNTYLIWLALIAIGSGSGCSGTYIFAQIIAGPKLAGKWTGFQNCFANFAGVVGPALTSYLVAHTGNFAYPLYVTAVIATFGGLAWYFVVGPVEQIAWPSSPGASQIGESVQQTI